MISAAGFVDKGLLINSGQFDGLDFNGAFDAIATALEAANQGSITTNYRLRDWGVSRQRYWGSPIPMYNLAEGGEIPVPLDKLPIELPTDVEMDGIQSPIKADPEWRKDQLNGKLWSERPIPLTPLWSPPGTTPALPALIWRAPCSTRSGPTTGCRLTSMCGSSTPFCTCSMPASTISCCVTKGW